MTIARRFEGGTPYSNWLRDEPTLDSNAFGYTTTDVDMVVAHYVPYEDNANKSTKYWMRIEEKMHMAYPDISQERLLKMIEMSTIPSVEYELGKTVYKGMHLLQFENTNPLDGKIYLDEEEISYEDFLKFHRFELDESYYIKNLFK